MNSITQVMKFRRSMVEYALKHGVTKTAIKYNTYRQYVYRWLRRYDGSLESLRNKSRRPKHHPKAHTAAELKLIQDMRRRNPEAGLVVFWVKLRQRGYSRSITGLYRTLKRIGMTPVKPPNPKYVPKPYEQMLYPGQRIQIDVKFVPSACLTGEAKGKRFYQYTAIDEFSRWRYVKPLKSTAPTLPSYFWCISFRLSRCLLNVCRQIMAPNSLNDSLKQVLTKTLLFLSVN